MRNTAKSILTTMPAKTIISNIFDFFFIEFPLTFRVRQGILNNIQIAVCQEIR
jgi:hypothetical protein